MMKSISRCGAVLFLLLLLLPTRALAGEDFPFFCSVQETPRSFSLVTDMDSPTGYTLVLYLRMRVEARAPAEVTSTADGKYWLVKAHQTGVVDRQVLAYIGLTDGRTSHGDVRSQRVLSKGRGWDLKPMSCKRL